MTWRDHEVPVPSHWVVSLLHVASLEQFSSSALSSSLASMMEQIQVGPVFQLTWLTQLYANVSLCTKPQPFLIFSKPQPLAISAPLGSPNPCLARCDPMRANGSQRHSGCEYCNAHIPYFLWAPTIFTNFVRS